MKLQSMYQGFDFGEVWTITPCSEYPYPQLQENLQAPANHTFGDWQVRKAATCTAKGEEYRVCVCGEEETREISHWDTALQNTFQITMLPVWKMGQKRPSVTDVMLRILCD